MKEYVKHLLSSLDGKKILAEMKEAGNIHIVDYDEEEKEEQAQPTQEEKEKTQSSFPVQTRLDEVIQSAREGRHLHIPMGTGKRSPEAQRQIEEAKAQMRKK